VWAKMAEYGNGKGSANENGKSKSKGTMNVVVAGKAVNGALLNAALPSNVMSSHTMKALGLKPTSPSTPGRIRDIPVVGTVRVLSTFRIWGLREDYYPLLLGAPYMSYVKNLPAEASYSIC